MATVKARRFLVLLACLLNFGIAQSKATDGPAVFSPAPQPGEIPYFSIALPPGWKMAADGRKQDSPSAQRHVMFTFVPAAADSPYVFIKVENCTEEVCAKRREQAATAGARRFMSDGEPDIEYFDAERNILWRRSENSRSPSIGATFYGKQIVNFQFFHQPGQLGNLTPTLRTIVDHLRVYEAGEESTTYAVDSDLYTPASESVWLRVLMWSTPFLLVVLIVVERLISKRKFREEMAQIDADIAERKERAAIPKSHLDAAGEYCQKTVTSRRRRKRGSA